jgi:hypothetical protein
MIGRRTGRRALHQRDEADHVDRLREEQQEACVVQAGRALEQHLDLRERRLVPVPLKTRGDLSRRLLVRHALAHILKQARWKFSSTVGEPGITIVLPAFGV